MNKLQKIAFIALVVEVLLWAAGRTVFPLPDWAVRLNGVMMLITLPLLAFASVRLKIKNS